ncbi:pantoate--beta-alanine ligase [bacterium]|nr:pantoate--beta-alanine ligase [bacterium]
MEVVHTIRELRAAVARARQAGRTIGFVPTMGCLHEGHLALVRRARAETGYVVVSIFVNPTQFGPTEDFAKYPRTLEADVAGSAAAGADLVFAPATEDFYAPGASTWVEETRVTQGLCGEFRPGHFRGVTTVVAMLFNAVQPDVAVFGRKDLQQLAALRRMVRDLLFPIRLVAHETVREANGVAMSSRNRYLSPADFAKAAAIPAALAAARALVAAGETDAARVRTAALARLEAEPALRPQYCEVVDALDLTPVRQVTPGRTILAVACHLGSTRLIDNADLG